ncbi:MAG: xanthine dehydrogenase family protein molybdopterin-binding subunit [Bacteroidia bacterium]
MTPTAYSRRSFLKASALAGGGLVLSFKWLTSCTPKGPAGLEMPETWTEINGYLKIGNNGVITIMSPNPEIGQNVKTSMPMLVAEELDADWSRVIVEQAPLDTKAFQHQIAGGSNSIREAWLPLRTAGATARFMLITAAAQQWGVDVKTVTTKLGVIYHEASGRKMGYGDIATAAAQVEVPAEVPLKAVKDFSIIGTSKKNVDGPKIVTGQPLYGLDYREDNMKIAMIIHPPAFGMRMKSFDATAARQMPGIVDVIEVNNYQPDQARGAFDFCAFTKLVAVVGNSTWEVMQAKKAVQVAWEEAPAETVHMSLFGRSVERNIPAGLESTAAYMAAMNAKGSQPGRIVRKDGDPDAAFARAARTLERTYTAPFLAHNAMEPMNFFADVNRERARLVGPIQTPEFMETAIADRFGLPKEKVEIMMTRQGGGFGRRLYGHWMLEAGVISQTIQAPVKLIYTREDDMTAGTYRPAYHACYKAAVDEQNNVTAILVRAGGMAESALRANRFPAGTVANYQAEDWSIETNITTGAFRAPGSNFIAGAEQSFLDELAEFVGKDPIDFRLELLEKAQTAPVGERNDYDPGRYAGVLKLVREKAAWDTPRPGISRGVAAYFCHNSYAAQIVDLSYTSGQPVIERVCCAIDCGIVVNRDAAINMAEGGIIDGIGHALYSQLTLQNGAPEQNNFNSYRLIRHAEAPRAIEVHFVESDTDPTGMGEPPFPPVMAALANALYQATGRRYYHQPFVQQGLAKT